MGQGVGLEALVFRMRQISVAGIRVGKVITNAWVKPSLSPSGLLFGPET